MKRMCIAAITAAAMLAGPAYAQETPPDTVPEEPTLQDDLDCTIFVAAVVGTIESQGGDEKAILGLSAGMVYFVGRYEGAGGTDLQDAIISRSRELSEADLQRLQSVCSKRMEEMGQKLIEVGNAVTEAQNEQAAPSE